MKNSEVLLEVAAILTLFKVSVLKVERNYLLLSRCESGDFVEKSWSVFANSAHGSSSGPFKRFEILTAENCLVVCFGISECLTAEVLNSPPNGLECLLFAYKFNASSTRTMAGGTIYGKEWCQCENNFLGTLDLNNRCRCACTEPYVGQRCELEKKISIACEDSYMLLSCPTGTRIHIAYANYGRTVTSTEICPYRSNHLDKTDCKLASAQSQVEAVCNENSSCTFYVGVNFFGEDPCFGTFKYTEVHFMCI